MSSIVMEPEARAVGEPIAGAAGDAEALCGLIDAVKASDAQIARAVMLAGRLAVSGASERVEGLPLEQLLGLAGRMTGADRRMLVNAGEVLRDLPAVSGLFTAGELSWGQVRAVVGAAKVLRKADREALDARVAETVAERGGVGGFDADQLVWAVYAAVEELTDPRRLERRERKLAEQNFLAVQGKLDGGISVYGEFDPVAGATIVGALDAASATPEAHPDNPDNADADADADAGEGRVGPSPATTAARGRAAGLVRICSDWLGGGKGRPARPLFVAHIDLAQARAAFAGTLELSVRGPLRRLTAATLDRLLSDADLRAVVLDGARPLGVSAKVRAADIPVRTRVAVAARDQGSPTPLGGGPAASPAPRIRSATATSTTSKNATAAATIIPTTSSPSPDATTRWSTATGGGSSSTPPAVSSPSSVATAPGIPYPRAPPSPAPPNGPTRSSAAGSRCRSNDAQRQRQLGVRHLGRWARTNRPGAGRSGPRPAGVPGR